MNEPQQTPPLTAKQERFVAEYMVDANATQAAIRAGYSRKMAQRIGSDNLQKPAVKEAVALRQREYAKRLDITAERVLTEIARIAFADYRNTQRLVRTIHADGTVEERVELVPTAEQTDDQAAAVAGYEEHLTESGIRTIRIKHLDKQRALETLAKHLNLLQPDAQVNLNVMTAELHLNRLSDEELDAIVARVQR